MPTMIANSPLDDDSWLPFNRAPHRIANTVVQQLSSSKEDDDGNDVMASRATRSTPNNRPFGAKTVGGSVEYRVASSMSTLAEARSSMGDIVMMKRRSRRRG